MKTVKSETTANFREKGSKFIGILYPAGSLEAFEEKREQVKSKYPDATHHCYAYRIDPNRLQEFAQDDGEPGGTAGLPILNRLKSYDLVNAGLIVVRYFGGTKLGKPGLIAAYGATASKCLEKAEFGDIARTENVRIVYPYDKQNQIERLISKFELAELEAEYLEEVTLVLACPIEKSEQMYEELERLVHLDIRYEELGKDFILG